jgi:hypothetical protein
MTNSKTRIVRAHRAGSILSCASYFWPEKSRRIIGGKVHPAANLQCSVSAMASSTESANSGSEIVDPERHLPVNLNGLAILSVALYCAGSRNAGTAEGKGAEAQF